MEWKATSKCLSKVATGGVYFDVCTHVACGSLNHSERRARTPLIGTPAYTPRQMHRGCSHRLDVDSGPDG